jgi:hypothetical protein
MSRYRAWQEGTPNDTPAGGPWFVTVPDGGHIEIGYDASGQPDEFHARLFAAAGNAMLDDVGGLRDQGNMMAVPRYPHGY